jgi:transcriptional regulator with XRE-family HTH domain
MDADRGARIKRLAERRGWESAHLARVLGVEESTLYGWYKGRRPSAESFERLAVLLETSRSFIEAGEQPERVERSAPPVVVLQEVNEALRALAQQAAQVEREEESPPKAP